MVTTEMMVSSFFPLYNNSQLLIMSSLSLVDNIGLCCYRFPKRCIDNNNCFRMVRQLQQQQHRRCCSSSSSSSSFISTAGMRPSFPLNVSLLHHQQHQQQRQYQQQHQQQIRTFVAKVRYSMKGFGPNGTKLKVCFCYNDHDLYARPKTYNHEKFQYYKCNFDYTDIQEKAITEYYGGVLPTIKSGSDHPHIDYYHNESRTWKQLTKNNMNELKSYKGGMKALNLRVPSVWTDYIHEDDLQKELGLSPNDIHPTLTKDDDKKDYTIQDVISALILTCRAMNIQRSKIRPYHLSIPQPDSGIDDTTPKKGQRMKERNHRCTYIHTKMNEISTQQWILQEATQDKTLQLILLREPGILNHLVTWMHYDSIWKKYYTNTTDNEHLNEMIAHHSTNSIITKKPSLRHQEVEERRQSYQINHIEFGNTFRSCSIK